MASNILLIPLRRSHPISLSTAMKQYISNKYDQRPEMFAEDLLIIDRLRMDAINVQEPHISGISRLVTYAAQLKWLGGKFPIDVGVEFSWYPALGFNTSRPISQNNLRFELANILFNLAALYSQLAASLNSTNPDNLKTACKYLCNAAGVLVHLRTDILPDLRSSRPEDMDEMTLRSLEELLLAQAQECFWQKAVKDGLKDASIARLAAKVSDLYAEAGDCGVKSDAISTEWIHHMTAKHHHFAAAAQYRQSRDCLEKQKYGEEVARLRDSVACVNEALKESKWISRVVLGDLNGLKARVTEDLKRAERDNDKIYLIPVPPKSELKLLDRANMATAKAPVEVTDALSMIGEGLPLGKPLFAKLVPYAVHVAASIYVERRDRLVQQEIVGGVEEMTAHLKELLQSLNLPGSLQALEKPLGLPPSLLSHAEEIRQQDGFNRLRLSLKDTAKLKANDKAIFTEGVELLMAERDEDDRARARYGTDRWTREPSEVAGKKLYTQAEEIQGYLASAENSDKLVEEKLRDTEKVLRVLTGTNRDIEAFVPSSRKANMTEAVEREAGRLRGCLNEVGRLESRRRRRIEALREKARGDSLVRRFREDCMGFVSGRRVEAGELETDITNTSAMASLSISQNQKQEQEQNPFPPPPASTILSPTAVAAANAAIHHHHQQQHQHQPFHGRQHHHPPRQKSPLKSTRSPTSGHTPFTPSTTTSSSPVAASAAAAAATTATTATTTSQPQPQPQPRPPTKESPLTAPQPTRASIIPPPITMPLPTMPTGGMWSPEMGIKFGSSAPAPAPASQIPMNGPDQAEQQTQAQAQAQMVSPMPMPMSTWDPSRGVRFS
ncbi:pH-response regulator protein palA/RIM20 [Histoplasma capsulatum]|uniref:pH-response regulator protein palA/RIM20 n=1 Tax=Ajellomyces capsulatus TaxID=5037 RepID=A0A8A1MF59_AJECA|nr:pH-response regulator protein palA/RIM20 [Histoplasma capsulatum]